MAVPIPSASRILTVPAAGCRTSAPGHVASLQHPKSRKASERQRRPFRTFPRRSWSDLLLGRATLALAAAVAIPLVVAAASPGAHFGLVALVVAFTGVVLPFYALVAPLYRWLLADEPLLAGWLRNVDPRLAMLSLRTDLASRAWPLATAGIALACALGFAAFSDPWEYGFRPDVRGDWPWTLALSLFLHADLEHLAGNLLFMWPMAAALEGRIARGRLVALFVAAGIAGNLASVTAARIFGHEFPVAIGASGSVAGLMGILIVRCAFARVTFGVPLFGAAELAIARVPIPAPVWAGLYFALDVSALIAPPDVFDDGIGHGAHIGALSLRRLCGTGTGSSPRSRGRTPGAPRAGRASSRRLRRSCCLPRRASGPRARSHRSPDCARSRGLTRFSFAGSRQRLRTCDPDPLAY